MAASLLHMTGTRTLFLAFAAVALSVLLWRPLCNAAHPDVHAGESPACCLNADAPSGAKALDLTADGGAKPLLAPRPLGYIVTGPVFIPIASRFATAAPPPRPFYVRSSRILR